MRIATLNVRNTADRWRDRRHLLVAQLVDLAPDLIGLQEVRMAPDQAGWIVREVERRSGGGLRYRRWVRGKTGLAGLWEGIAVLSRVPVVATGWVPLGGQGRVVQRVSVRAPGAGVVDLYNTHLGVGGEGLREAQARRILAWIGSRPPGPVVLVGDLNARPGSPTIELLSSRLRSAHAAVHGHEPSSTVPTALRRGRAGTPSVLDYVLVNERVEVDDARVVFDRVAPSDPTLVASDHYGLVVAVTVRDGTGSA